MELVLYRPDPPILKSYASALRSRTVLNRTRYQGYQDSCAITLAELFAQFPKLTAQIESLQASINLLMVGVPDTEGVKAVGSLTGQTNAVADAFLLKKAFRAAAHIAHPDKGGSNEDFAALRAAYKAGNLSSLNEYLIARNKSFLDQINYWLVEVDKPEVEWLSYQATEQYRLVQMSRSGNIQGALRATQRVLELAVVNLLHELSNQSN